MTLSKWNKKIFEKNLEIFFLLNLIFNFVKIIFNWVWVYDIK